MKFGELAEGTFWTFEEDDWFYNTKEVHLKESPNASICFRENGSTDGLIWGVDQKVCVVPFDAVKNRFPQVPSERLREAERATGKRRDWIIPACHADVKITRGLTEDNPHYGHPEFGKCTFIKS